MATAIPIPTSVHLFYSYAHADEPLCEKLQIHLTGLKRAGLISDWSDRKILPGDEWNVQIQKAIERAGIILLLVSAEFFSSEYIFKFELPLALARHELGFARVIPVLLRPFEWRDSAVAKLQMLPSDARPVTSWPNEDEAFCDVAGRLREVLYQQRLSESTPKFQTSSGFVSDVRVLDAAISSAVIVDEPTDLVALIRGEGSTGLKAILQLDRTYSATPEDVQSKKVELTFPTNAAGVPLPLELKFAVDSPGFAPSRQEKLVQIPPNRDSDVFVFMLTPQKSGRLRLNIDVIVNGTCIASRLLSTMAVDAPSAPRFLSYQVVSFDLAGSAKVLQEASAKERQEFLWGNPQAAGPVGVSETPKPREVAIAGVAAVQKKSGLPIWLSGTVGLMAAATVIALLIRPSFQPSSSPQVMAPADNTSPSPISPQSPAQPAVSQHAQPAITPPTAVRNVLPPSQSAPTAAQSAPPATQSAPPPAVQSSPPATQSAPPPDNQNAPPATQSAPPPPPDVQNRASEEDIQKVQERLMEMRSRADAIGQVLNSVRRSQAASGLEMNPEFTAAFSRLQYYLQAAEKALKDKDLASAGKDMDNAEKLLSFLEARFQNR